LHPFAGFRLKTTDRQTNGLIVALYIMSQKRHVSKLILFKACYNAECFSDVLVEYLSRYCSANSYTNIIMRRVRSGRHTAEHRPFDDFPASAVTVGGSL